MTRAPVSIQHPAILRLDPEHTAEWDGVCLNVFEEGVGCPVVCLSRAQVQKLANMIGLSELARVMRERG